MPAGIPEVDQSQLCARKGMCPGVLPLSRGMRDLPQQDERDVCYRAMVRLTHFVHRHVVPYVSSNGCFAPPPPAAKSRPHMADVLLMCFQPSLQPLCAEMGWHLRPDLQMARPHAFARMRKQLVQRTRKHEHVRILLDGALGTELCSWLCLGGRTFLLHECRAKQRVLLKAVAARDPAGFAAAAPELLEYTRSKLVQGRKERQVQWLEGVCCGTSGEG